MAVRDLPRVYLPENSIIEKRYFYTACEMLYRTDRVGPQQQSRVNSLLTLEKKTKRLNSPPPR